jgi:bacterioferritin
VILFIGDRDPTTRRLLEDVLAAEEEHADDLTSLMFVDVDAAGVRNG